MINSGITIISFSTFDPLTIQKLAESVAAEFNAKVKIIEGRLDLSDYFDPTRSQYNANELLSAVEQLFSGKDDKTIGLFGVDLFIPILTYIFGQAYLNGQTAIASTHRLSNSRYGLKDDPEKRLQRITKEAIHELGHSYGLIHCHTPNCVMASSTYVEDIDQKSHHLCQSCHKGIWAS